MISMAYAADAAAGAAGGTSSFTTYNIIMILVLFFLFYILLIRPQNKRIEEQRKMMDKLQKGDKIITGGGLLGKISKLVSDKEVEVDLGNGVKVTALRYTLQLQDEYTLKPYPNKDKGKDEAEESDAKAEEADASKDEEKKDNAA